MGKGPCSAASSSAGAGAAAAFWGAADDDMGPLAATGGHEGRRFGGWFLGSKRRPEGGKHLWLGFRSRFLPSEDWGKM